METRNLKISKETANRWYNGNDTELKQLALQTFPELAEKELPKSWEGLGEISGYCVNGFDEIDYLKDCSTKDRGNKTIFATREQAEASIALAQLSQLMKVYNDGWVADYEKGNSQDKYIIDFCQGIIRTEYFRNQQRFLAFKDAKTRDLFLKNFRDLILTAKPLLG
jgi:hypothetical protein